MNIISIRKTIRKLLNKRKDIVYFNKRVAEASCYSWIRNLMRLIPTLRGIEKTSFKWYLEQHVDALSKIQFTPEEVRRYRASYPFDINNERIVR